MLYVNICNMVARPEAQPPVPAKTRAALVADLNSLLTAADSLTQALAQPSQSHLAKADLALVNRARNSCQTAAQVLSNAEVELLRTRITQGRSQAKKRINKWIDSATGPGVVVVVQELKELLAQMSKL